jgi:hypothetical protein
MAVLRTINVLPEGSQEVHLRRLMLAQMLAVSGIGAAEAASNSNHDSPQDYKSVAGGKSRVHLRRFEQCGREAT